MGMGRKHHKPPDGGAGAGIGQRNQNQGKNWGFRGNPRWGARSVRCPSSLVATKTESHTGEVRRRARERREEET